MMKKILIITLLSFLFTGCYSKLKVVVRTADREKVIEYGGDLIRADIINATTTIESFLNNSESDKVKIMEKITAAIIAEHGGQGKIHPNTEKLLYDDFDDAIRRIRLENESAIGALNIVDNTTDKKAINDAYIKAYYYVDNARLLMSTFIFNTAKKGKIENVDVNSLTSGTTLATSNEELKSSRMRFPIIGDPLTSYITKDESKKIWKSTFNKTRTTTFIGNSDIAVILRSNPPEKETKSGDYNNNFTIKGVRMDAADATNALFTGLAQTMNFIASIQSGQLPQATKPTAENPAAETSPLMDSIEANKKALNEKTKKLETAKKMLLQKMLIENIGSKEDDELSASIKRIEDYWTELKKTIE